VNVTVTVSAVHVHAIDVRTWRGDDFVPGVPGKLVVLSRTATELVDGCPSIDHVFATELLGESIETEPTPDIQKDTDANPIPGGTGARNETVDPSSMYSPTVKPRERPAVANEC